MKLFSDDERVTLQTTGLLKGLYFARALHACVWLRTTTTSVDLGRSERKVKAAAFKKPHLRHCGGALEYS